MKNIYVIIATLAFSSSANASSRNLNGSQLPLAHEHTNALKKQTFDNNLAAYGLKSKKPQNSDNKESNKKKCIIS